MVITLCGIVGAAGLLTKAREDAFKTMLRLDTLRGPHSTGVLAVNSTGQTEVQKCLGTPWDFFDSKKCEAIFRPFSNVLVGHNRYATQGKINKENAHPFEFPNYIGVHNGTLRGQHRLPDHRNFEVDSENIYHSMQEEGEIETLENLDGAYALVWWNKEDRMLRIARNNERPMYYAYSDDNKAVFFASEAWMITVACGRNNVKIQEVKEIEEEHIYDFDIPLQGYSGNQIVAEPHLTRFWEYVRPLPVTTSKYTSTSTKGGNGSGTSQKKDVAGHQTSSTTSSADKKETSGNVVSISDGNVFAGDVVEFMILAETTKKFTGSFIEGITVDDETNVRVYAPYMGQRWKSIVDDDSGFFMGKVARIKWENGTKFLILDVSSISPSDQQIDNGKFPIHDDNVSEEEWERHTENGCCICGDASQKDNAKQYLWVANRTYACEKCKDLPVVQDYIQA